MAAIEIAPIVIDPANPETWPVRMTRQEIQAVLRISQSEMYRRMQQGRFPRSDDGRTWCRDVVKNYVFGGIRRFEAEFERRTRAPRTLRAVGGKR